MTHVSGDGGGWWVRITLLYVWHHDAVTTCDVDGLKATTSELKTGLKDHLVSCGEVSTQVRVAWC